MRVVGLGAVVMLAGCHRETTRVAKRQAPPAVVAAARSSSKKPVAAKSKDVWVAAKKPAAGKSSGPVTGPAVDGDSGAGEEVSATGKVMSTETGLASWYGPPYNHRKGANGEVYDQNAMTAAHKTLPMGTKVRVTNLATNEAVTVVITDRGPFVHGRVIDLSLAAAKATGLYRMGVAKVKVEVLAAGKTASTGGKWCVQIGAFAKASDSVKLKNDLMHRYQTAKVIEFPGPTGHWVRVNPAVNDKAHATQIAESVRPGQADAQAYVVRLD